MKLNISNARARLGEVVLHVQNPNEVAVLTRHGVPVAAVVGMDNLRRIWSMEDEQDGGMLPHPLYNMLVKRGASHSATGEVGLNGKLVSKSEAALQMRTVQLTRAEERRILKAGGLEEVDGGELRLEEGVRVEGYTVDVDSGSRAESQGRWKFWRRR